MPSSALMQARPSSRSFFGKASPPYLGIKGFLRLCLEFEDLENAFVLRYVLFSHRLAIHLSRTSAIAIARIIVAPQMAWVRWGLKPSRLKPVEIS
jgi:hypothetical protein